MIHKYLLKTVFLSLFTIGVSFSQTEIYNADFSTNGNGLPDHTRSNEPANGPVTTAVFGTAPNQWKLSYDVKPLTDGSGNLFKVRSGKLETTDWGGEAFFTSESIDITGKTSINIEAIGKTYPKAANGSGEYFNYFYILDGGAKVEIPADVFKKPSNTPVNLSITELDVTDKSTLVVGFSFKANGGGSGYSIESFKVSAKNSAPKTYTWAGSASNDWDTPSNWDINEVPVAGSDVVIPAGLSTNYPTATSIADVSKIAIKNDATLILTSPTNAAVEYVKDINTTDWMLMSAPLSGATIEDLITNTQFALGTNPNIGLGIHKNNGSFPWSYKSTASTGSIDNAKGISVKIAGSSITFNGKLNTGNTSINITKGDRSDFNLIGNPYTAYLNSTKFLNANEASLSEKTIWVWNGTEYSTVNLTNASEIESTKGFFVKAGTDGSVNFETSMLSHKTRASRKSPKPSFELFVENETNKKSTKLFYIEGTSEGFDNGYDSSIFNDANNNGLELFTQLVANNNGEKLGIQSLPSSNLETMVVPVGLNAKAGKELTFSVNTKNIPTGVNVYLEDRNANTFVNLSEENHKTVLKKASNGVGQFYIHTTAKKLEEKIINDDLGKINIYKSENNSVTIKGLQANNASLNVFSILGAKIFSTQFNSTGVSVIQLPKTSKGIYIVKVNSSLGETSQKIILE